MSLDSDPRSQHFVSLCQVPYLVATYSRTVMHIGPKLKKVGIPNLNAEFIDQILGHMFTSFIISLSLSLSPGFPLSFPRQCGGILQFDGIFHLILINYSYRMFLVLINLIR